MQFRIASRNMHNTYIKWMGIAHKTHQKNGMHSQDLL